MNLHFKRQQNKQPTHFPEQLITWMELQDNHDPIEINDFEKSANRLMNNQPKLFEDFERNGLLQKSHTLRPFKFKRNVLHEKIKAGVWYWLKYQKSQTVHKTLELLYVTATESNGIHVTRFGECSSIADTRHIEFKSFYHLEKYQGEFMRARYYPERVVKPCIWTGKPYHSSPIQFAPELTLKDVRYVQIFHPSQKENPDSDFAVYINGEIYCSIEMFKHKNKWHIENDISDDFKRLTLLANNDGFYAVMDFIDWFKKGGEFQFLGWQEHCYLTTDREYSIGVDVAAEDSTHVSYDVHLQKDGGMQEFKMGVEIPQPEIITRPEPLDMNTKFYGTPASLEAIREMYASGKMEEIINNPEITLDHISDALTAIQFKQLKEIETEINQREATDRTLEPIDFDLSECTQTWNSNERRNVVIEFDDDADADKIKEVIEKFTNSDSIILKNESPIKEITIHQLKAQDKLNASNAEKMRQEMRKVSAQMKASLNKISEAAKMMEKAIKDFAVVSTQVNHLDVYGDVDGRMTASSEQGHIEEAQKRNIGTYKATLESMKEVDTQDFYQYPLPDAHENPNELKYSPGYLNKLNEAIENAETLDEAIDNTFDVVLDSTKESSQLRPLFMCDICEHKQETREGQKIVNCKQNHWIGENYGMKELPTLEQDFVDPWASCKDYTCKQLNVERISGEIFGEHNMQLELDKQEQLADEIVFKCDTCKYNKHESDELGSHVWCSKNHWNGMGAMTHDDRDKDPWRDCKDYAQNTTETHVVIENKAIDNSGNIVEHECDGQAESDDEQQDDLPRCEYCKKELTDDTVLFDSTCCIDCGPF